MGNREGWAVNGKGVLVGPTDRTHPMNTAVAFASKVEAPTLPGGPLRTIKAFKRVAPGVVLILDECGHEVVMKTPHFDGNPVPCPECAGKGGV